MKKRNNTNRGLLKDVPVDADAALCGDAVTVQACNQQPCETYTYVTGQWGPCNEQCGRGLRFRSTKCKSSKGHTVSRKKCEGVTDELMAIFDECNTNECPSLYYDYSAWGACSEECGGGVKTRTATCMKDSTPVADSECASKTKRSLEKPCNKNPCAMPTIWTEEEWGMCDLPCGGKRTRPEATCKCDQTSCLPLAFCFLCEHS